MQFLEKYRFLQVAQLIFNVLSWMALGIGIVASVVILVGGGTPNAPRMISLVSLGLGILYWFILKVISEVVKLMVDLANR